MSGPIKVTVNSKPIKIKVSGARGPQGPPGTDGSGGSGASPGGLISAFDFRRLPDGKITDHPTNGDGTLDPIAWQSFSDPGTVPPAMFDRADFTGAADSQEAWAVDGAMISRQNEGGSGLCGIVLVRTGVPGALTSGRITSHCGGLIGTDNGGIDDMADMHNEVSTAVGPAIAITVAYYPNHSGGQTVVSIRQNSIDYWSTTLPGDQCRGTWALEWEPADSGGTLLRAIRDGVTLGDYTKSDLDPNDLVIVGCLLRSTDGVSLSHRMEWAAWSDVGVPILTMGAVDPYQAPGALDITSNDATVTIDDGTPGTVDLSVAEFAHLEVVTGPTTHNLVASTNRLQVDTTAGGVTVNLPSSKRWEVVLDHFAGTGDIVVKDQFGATLETIDGASGARYWRLSPVHDQWIVRAVDPSVTSVDGFTGDVDLTSTYDPINAASGAVSTHVAASDPHTGYLKKSDNLASIISASSARSNLGLGSLATKSAIASSDITDGTIVNGDISASAGIAISKLANLADQRILGNNAGTSGPPLELTPAQVSTFLQSVKAPYASPTQVANMFGIPGLGVSTSASSATLTANRLYYDFWIVPFDLSITSVRARVITGAATGKLIRLGLVPVGNNLNPSGAAYGESSSIACDTSSTNIVWTPGTPIALSAGQIVAFSIQSDGGPIIRAMAFGGDPFVWANLDSSGTGDITPSVSRSFAALSGTPPAWDTVISTSISSTAHHKAFATWTV